jgi:hypothetical protein
MTANQAAAVNAPVALWFQVGHPWRASLSSDVSCGFAHSFMKTSPGRIASYISIPAVLFSIGLATWIHSAYPALPRPQPWQTVSYVLVGIWVLCPPIFFWLEWVLWTPVSEQETTKHTHDLARNIWLALIVILAVILDIKWPNG